MAEIGEGRDAAAGNGVLLIVFFLYLVRTEVRARLR